MEQEKASNIGQSKGKLVLIIGPSGVGKSVILKALQKENTGLHFPRSATTRPKRPGEGDDLYRFVTEEEFDELIEKNEMLEWAVVHGGARYGTLAEEIVPFVEQGKIVVREIDVQGFDSIANHRLFRKPDAHHQLQTIFILPENKEQIITHIQDRAPMSEEELMRRIASMEKELNYADRCDDKIVNKENQLKQTITKVKEAINS
jgi:guanylate kinase